MTKSAAWIIDLDGTLVDNAHLLYLAHEQADYDLFHAASEACKPRRWVKNDLLSIFSAANVLIITARSDRYRTGTEEWLKLWDVPYDALLMRIHGDERDDVEVKAELLSGALEYYDIVGAYEDNPIVADYWESQGILTVRVGAEEPA